MTMRWKGIVKELRDEGLEVRTVKGWKTRGVGGFFDPEGVMPHHTGSNRHSGNAPALGIVTHGRDDIPGPLSQILLARDGTVVFVARGKANHGGLGGPKWWLPRNYANALMIGIEAENDGIGEPWSDKQKRAYAILSAVLLRRMKKRWKRRIIAHKEYAPDRKIDPAGINMNKFRRRAIKILRRLKKR